MKSRIWRWAKLMGIGAFCVMLLSIGARPAEALPPRPCLDCEPGDDEPPPPPPSPPPPASYVCQYDYDGQTATSMPATGWGPSLPIQRATQKTTVGGWCSNACPNASYKWQGPFGSYCDCYYDTIPQLRAAGVGNWEIHRTRYAIWSAPAVANTRTLLIALAGQHGVSGSSGAGGPGNVTGQPDAWASSCTDWTCGSKTFSPRSFVGRLLLAPGMNINGGNTFAVSFPDHQYDYTSPYKTQIIKGLVDWLSTKVSPASLQQIIITGHSRGGCLALGLAKEFRARPYTYNSVRILGTPVDGTCDGGEMGTSNAWFDDVDNPRPDVPGDWYGWKSAFSTADNRSVCLQNTVGGEPQVAGIHSFYLTNTAVWNNSWINLRHGICGTCLDNNHAIDNCGTTGTYHTKRDVVDRALRFVERNRIP